MKTAFIICLLLPFLSYAQSREEILQSISDREKEAERLVELQLQAYNAGDIKKFLSAYSDSVEVYTFPDILKYKGIQRMRDAYEGAFSKANERSAIVTKRILCGDHVIDHEEIRSLNSGLIIRPVVIYVIRENKISEVYFVKQM